MPTKNAVYGRRTNRRGTLERVRPTCEATRYESKQRRATVRAASSLVSHDPSLFFSHDIVRRDHAQRIEPTTIRSEHSKLESVHDERFASSR